ncbi:MAG: hypothetical protein FWG77_00170 [Treponema sp.]|nr:hypothetical protein [Treponema sp.]
MSLPFYAKSPGNEGYIKNMEVIAYHDLNGIMAFQMALYKTAKGRYYLYNGSFKGAGFNILEVTDPSKPRLVRFQEVCDPKLYTKQSTPKIQAADDLLIVALGGGIPYLHGVSYEEKNIGGLQIFSLKEDPEHPKLLSHWETGVRDGMGVHRFMYNGGRYVHLSSDCPGYIGQIYRILDIEDPSSPIEVGRWWMPEQFSDGMEVGTYPVGHRDEKDWPQLHGPPYVQDDIAYCGYWAGGGILVDVKDITRPKKLGQIKMTPPFSGKLAGARCHTFLPLRGRNFAVLTNEGERFASWSPEVIGKSAHPGAQPMNNIHMIDVTNKADPVLVAGFPYPEVPKDFPWPNFNDCGIGCQGPFGPHNLHEPMGKPWLEDNPNRVYCCYFHAGMRIYDVSDPYYVKEIAYFIPPNPERKYFEVNMPGPLLGTTEDCVVDDRGNIFMDCFHDGLYILRLKI